MNYTLNYICKEMKLSIFMSLHFSSYMHFFMMLLEESITNMKIMVFIVVYRTFIFCYKKFSVYWSLYWVLVFFGAWAIWRKWVKNESFFSFLIISGSVWKNIVFVIFIFQWGSGLTVPLKERVNCVSTFTINANMKELN